jgi:hypothetical protein
LLEGRVILQHHTGCERHWNVAASESADHRHRLQEINAQDPREVKHQARLYATSRNGVLAMHVTRHQDGIVETGAQQIGFSVPLANAFMSLLQLLFKRSYTHQIGL